VGDQIVVGALEDGHHVGVAVKAENDDGDGEKRLEVELEKVHALPPLVPVRHNLQATPVSTWTPHSGRRHAAIRLAADASKLVSSGVARILAA